MEVIRLGAEVQDKISGLKGIATSITEFIYGCRRVGITPRELKDGRPVEESVIDEPQCEIIGNGIIVEKKKVTDRRYGDPDFRPLKHTVNLRK